MNNDDEWIPMDQVKKNIDRWKLPMLIASNPELMENKSVRESFEGLVNVDAEGHYVDSWESSVLLAETCELFGSLSTFSRSSRSGARRETDDGI